MCAGGRRGFCASPISAPVWFVWLFVWLVADGWYWFVLREKYCWLVAGGWFVVREKYCWLMADKPSEQGINPASVAAAQPRIVDADVFLLFIGSLIIQITS
jgi:hypothetical protein